MLRSCFVFQNQPQLFLADNSVTIKKVRKDLVRRSPDQKVFWIIVAHSFPWVNKFPLVISFAKPSFEQVTALA